MITGETGTGKELAAQEIHKQTARHKHPFVPVNCSEFPESLFESELFGYERGTFTGADRRREGRFEEANNGTIFLDKITEMPLAMQAAVIAAGK